MSLINLTQEFQNGRLQFDLPGLTDGFVKIALSARINNVNPTTDMLRVQINGPNIHRYNRGVKSEDLGTGGLNNEGATDEDTSIPISDTSEFMSAMLFEAELTIAPHPELLGATVRSQCSAYEIQMAGGPLFAGRANTAVTAGYMTTTPPYRTLNSIGFFMSGGQGTACQVGLFGHARLSWYPHLTGLQQEI